MSDKPSYAGKVKNSGAQYVEAIHKQPQPADQSRIKTGKDLRVKGGKG
ncbi:MAG: hypothetical protein J6K89_07815 [Oscillospiraceae bacterium]|nr:hypothetical protein [Oscillospiraceae bacterium]